MRAYADIPGRGVEEARRPDLERLNRLIEQAWAVMEREHVTVSHGHVVGKQTGWKRDPETDEVLRDDEGAPVPEYEDILDDGPLLAAVREIRGLLERRAKIIGYEAPTRHEFPNTTRSTRRYGNSRSSSTRRQHQITPGDSARLFDVRSRRAAVLEHRLSAPGHGQPDLTRIDMDNVTGLRKNAPPRSRPRDAEIAAEAKFRARLTELGATLLEPDWLTRGVVLHHCRCAAYHDCYPLPANVNRGAAICRVCVVGSDPAAAEAARAKIAELWRRSRWRAPRPRLRSSASATQQATTPIRRPTRSGIAASPPDLLWAARRRDG